MMEMFILNRSTKKPATAQVYLSYIWKPLSPKQSPMITRGKIYTSFLMQILQSQIVFKINTCIASGISGIWTIILTVTTVTNRVWNLMVRTRGAAAVKQAGRSDILRQSRKCNSDLNISGIFSENNIHLLNYADEVAGSRQLSIN